jgi:hypothetical protein
MKNAVFWDVTPFDSWFLQEPHDVTSQKTQFLLLQVFKGKLTAGVGVGIEFATDGPSVSMSWCGAAL